MANKHTYSPTRLAWMGLGLLCVGLALIGVLLPLMPTTIFLIIAAFAFARSSPRLHSWLLQHRIFGPLLKDWQDHKAINRKAKLMSTLSILSVLVISFLLGVPRIIFIIQAICLGVIVVFIVTRPLPPVSHKSEQT